MLDLYMGFVDAAMVLMLVTMIIRELRNIKVIVEYSDISCIANNYNEEDIQMNTVYKLNQVIRENPTDCIRVDCAGDTIYCSRKYYDQWVLDMSTGDFHTHQARIAFLGEADDVLDLTDMNEAEVFEAEFYRFREAPMPIQVPHSNLYSLANYRIRKAK